MKINEFRIGSGSAGNATDSFIELYNAGTTTWTSPNWSLTERPAQQAVFSSVQIPAGTKLKAKGFYLLGLSNSGLAVPARAGDTTISVREVTGMSAGDTVEIGTGARRGDPQDQQRGDRRQRSHDCVAALARWSDHAVSGVDQRSGSECRRLQGRREDCPRLRSAMPSARAAAWSSMKMATVTAVGKPGTQAYLAADAPAGATKIQVTAVANISVGDKIRLDIDSAGHGIETVTVTACRHQGDPDQPDRRRDAGATRIRVRTGRRICRGRQDHGRHACQQGSGDRELRLEREGPTARRSRSRRALPKSTDAMSGSWLRAQRSRSGGSAALQPCREPAVQRPGDGDHLRACDEVCPRQRRAGSGPWLRRHPGPARWRRATQINSVVRDAKVTTAGYREPQAGPVVWWS